MLLILPPIRSLLMLALLAGSFGYTPSTLASDKIRLQLKWHHQFQFAGYYAAQHKGFYKEEGLDVDIREGSSGEPIIPAVLEGRADYGVSDTSVLLARMYGRPVVVMAAIFQHSPYALLSKSENPISRPADLIGKRLMLTPGQGSAQFEAMMLKAGLDPKSVHFVPHNGSVEDLMAGKVDAMLGYRTTEPYQLKNKGITPTVMSVTDHGVDFYVDTLFTTQDHIHQHPEEAKSFRRASIKGWYYAFSHPDEIIDLILGMPGVAERGITREALQAEVTSMRELVMPDIIEIGHMSDERWESIAKSLADLKIAPSRFDLNGFMYLPDSSSENHLRWLFSVGAGGIAAILLGLLWNMQMRRQVKTRTQALQAEIARREQTEAYMRISGRMARVGSWVLELPEKRLYWSEEVAAIHEWPHSDAPPLDEALKFYPEEWREKIQASIDKCITDGGSFDEELPLLTYKDNLLWIRVIGLAVRDDLGNNLRIEGALQDISAQKVAESRIQHLAFYDSLTSLPNRQLLIDRLEHTLVYCARTGKSGALLFIDLDNFKTLNDTLGHDLGDLLLQQVAMRIAGCLRESDTVARFGGDEFVVLLPELSGDHNEAATQAKLVSEKILTSFSHPFKFSGYEHHSSASIGVTLFNRQPTTVDEILKRADMAMYQSKAAGRNVVRFFDPDMQALIAYRAELEEDLRMGLRNHEFHLCFQPQVDGNGKLIGAEALLRWKHSRRGLVPPMDFIPLAEDSGLIVKLGEWVIRTACVQLVIWEARPETAALTIAVNVSAKQFRQPDFADKVAEMIAATGANPQRLKFELTESLMVENIEDVISKMTQLQGKGVGFSIDDFGIGYSSLFYLKRLPLDQLKIDQSFVRDVLTDPNDAVIARTIIALGQSLNLQVIAEGVETDGQRLFLESYGCNAYQGYLYGKPMPIAEFEAAVLSTLHRDVAGSL